VACPFPHDDVTVNPDLALGQKHGKPSEQERRRPFGAPAPAEHRTDAGRHFSGDERLDDEVVSTEVKGLHRLGSGIGAGHEDNGDAAVLPDRDQCVDPGCGGIGGVDHDDVGVVNGVGRLRHCPGDDAEPLVTVKRLEQRGAEGARR
jgi:hypothetical protein